MTFDRTFDNTQIRGLMTHPKIWPHISDDFSPAPDDFRPPESEAVWFVKAEDGEGLIGVWIFVPQNAVCWEVHTCANPEAWGRRTLQAARELSGWIFANTPCLRIVTCVPSTNRLALRLAKGAGMKEYGVNVKSFMKGGQLQDQILLGLSKE